MPPSPTATPSDPNTPKPRPCVIASRPSAPPCLGACQRCFPHVGVYSCSPARPQTRALGLCLVCSGHRLWTRQCCECYSLGLCQAPLPCACRARDRQDVFRLEAPAGRSIPSHTHRPVLAPSAACNGRRVEEHFPIKGVRGRAQGGAREWVRTTGCSVQDDLAIMIEGADGRYYFQAGAICLAGVCARIALQAVVTIIHRDVAAGGQDWDGTGRDTHVGACAAMCVAHVACFLRSASFPFPR